MGTGILSLASGLQSGMVKVDLRPDDIRKEGWINKESAVLRTYRRRWLVLTPERLYSFKSERKYADPTEEIDLRQCGTVKSADDLTNRPYSFTVQVPDRNFFLIADSETDRRWLETRRH